MIGTLDLTVLIDLAIGVVAIAVAIYLWRRGRVRPALSYRLLSARVVNVDQGVEDRISVLYDDKAVTDVRLLDLRVENTGTAAITADAFETPLSIALGEGARVLNQPSVGKTVPPELQPHVSVEGQDLVIAPLLLNAGDSFEVTALVSQLSDGNCLRARIAGVPKLINTGTGSAESERMNRTTTSPRSIVLPIVGMFIVLAIWIYAHVFVGEPRNHTRVVLTSGPPLCGDVLHTDAKTLVVKLKDTGTLRTLPVAQIKAIRDDAC